MIIKLPCISNLHRNSIFFSLCCYLYWY